MDLQTSLWHTSPHDTIWRETALTAPSSSNPWLIRSGYSLISNGTERLVATGKVPVSAHKRMQVPHMQGGFELPILYGYSLVGELVPSRKDQPFSGWVHLMHPHASLCQVESAACFSVPQDIPPARATLAANMETAITAIWDGTVGLGDRTLVIGFGLIGALVAHLLESRCGAQVDIFEVEPTRAALATSLGFRVLPQATQAYDISFHTSGTSAGLQTAIDQVGKGGRIVELSWYGEQSVSLQLGSGFHYDRKQIISSQVGTIPARQIDRWDFRRRKELVFELLRDSWYDQLITLLQKEQVIQHFSLLRQGRPVPLAPVIDYSTFSS
jgi:hypothetical protein